jgi:hypothetical protein
MMGKRTENCVKRLSQKSIPEYLPVRRYDGKYQNSIIIFFPPFLPCPPAGGFPAINSFEDNLFNKYSDKNHNAFHRKAVFAKQGLSIRQYNPSIYCSFSANESLSFHFIANAW